MIVASFSNLLCLVAEVKLTIMLMLVDFGGQECIRRS